LIEIVTRAAKQRDHFADEAGSIKRFFSIAASMPCGPLRLPPVFLPFDRGIDPRGDILRILQHEHLQALAGQFVATVGA